MRLGPGNFDLAKAVLKLGFMALATVPGNAEPKYFYLQAQQQDTVAPYAFGVLDAHDTQGNLTGYIQLNEPSNSDSQLWTEINDDAQTPSGVHLQNKATGLCIGDSNASDARPTLLNCGLGETFWLEIPKAPGPKSVAFQRDIKLNYPGASFKICIGKDPAAAGVAYIYGCSSQIDGYEIWEATNEPIGTASSGSSTNPSPPTPPPPPLRPTNCELSGTAICGLVGFTCNPLSAADKVIVSSGRIGVSVTSVQPQLGLVEGTYLNTGQASVQVCAIKSGQTACSDNIDVTFGATLCVHPPPERQCPTGEVLCQGVCQRPGSPDCRIE